MKVTLTGFDRGRNDFKAVDEAGRECIVDPFVSCALPQAGNDGEDYEAHVAYAETFVGRTFEMREVCVVSPCYVPSVFTEVEPST